MSTHHWTDRCDIILSHIHMLLASSVFVELVLLTLCAIGPSISCSLNPPGKSKNWSKITWKFFALASSTLPAISKLLSSPYQLRLSLGLACDVQVLVQSVPICMLMPRSATCLRALFVICVYISFLGACENPMHLFRCLYIPPHCFSHHQDWRRPARHYGPTGTWAPSSTSTQGYS